MKQIGIVITDGVGYRNFVITDFLKEAEKKFYKVVILSYLPKAVYHENDNLKIIELNTFTESFFNWFFRKAKEICHLKTYEKNTFGIEDSLSINYSKSKTPRGTATRFIFRLTSIFKGEKNIQLFQKIQYFILKRNKITKEYIEILKHENFDMLFFTHQRPPYIAPLISAAEKLRIKKGTFIFSWDNLASKGRMVANFDFYLVWSDLMKRELLEFYQNVNSSQIRIVGTPQFEPYVYNEFGLSKSELYNMFQITEELPIILFTCNDSSSVNDPIYLDTLAQFITKNKLVSNVNLIVRTSPVEEPSRFKEIRQKYSFIKWNYPDWTLTRNKHQESWSQRIPSIDDVHVLKGLLKYSDLVINVLSTITLDAFIFNKPVINPVFGNDQNLMFNDQKFLRYRHLEYLVNSESSIITKTEEEYLCAINMILSGGDNKEKERQVFLNLEVGKQLEKTSKRISDTLLELC
ncbi:hypothetical protein [Yeosuana sp. AK3]